jgi:hypothetical protein
LTDGQNRASQGRRSGRQKRGGGIRWRDAAHHAGAIVPRLLGHKVAPERIEETIRKIYKEHGESLSDGTISQLLGRRSGGKASMTQGRGKRGRRKAKAASTAPRKRGAQGKRSPQSGSTHGSDADELPPVTIGLGISEPKAGSRKPAARAPESESADDELPEVQVMERAGQSADE